MIVGTVRNGAKASPWTADLADDAASAWFVRLQMASFRHPRCRGETWKVTQRYVKKNREADMVASASAMMLVTRLRSGPGGRGPHT